PVPGRGVRRGDPPRRGARAHRAAGLVGFGAVPVTVTPLPAAEPRPRRVAMGMFDGVHLGHRAVIEGSDTVLTFDPHPLRVIHPEAAPKLIMPFEVKRDVIEGLGVEEIVVIPFDHAFSTIPPEEFCSR